MLSRFTGAGADRSRAGAVYVLRVLSVFVLAGAVLAGSLLVLDLVLAGAALSLMRST